MIEANIEDRRPRVDQLPNRCSSPFVEESPNRAPASSTRRDGPTPWRAGASSPSGASHQALSVFRYARSTHGSESPLVMAGIDCPFSGRASEGVEGFILRFFDETDPDQLSDDLR